MQRYTTQSLWRACALSTIRPALPLTSRRWQATVASAPDGSAVTATNRAEKTLKRFWKTVGVDRSENGYAVTLDKRSLKTPSGNRLLVPHEKALAATLVANEWENQESLLKPHALPMTSLVSRAIDAMNHEPTRSEVREALLKYLDTDTICFHETEPHQLDRLQKEHWIPLLEWAKDTYDIEILTFDSVLSSPQPAETIAKLNHVMSSFTPWEMAAMERVTYVTKSFLIALALVKGRITTEQAALAAQVEVNSQIERWGEVEDTHDVDYQDVRCQLGSASVLLGSL